ncbi:MAG: AFG1 family ATPase [Gammaproteobacteria bacterium]|nr:AFG1 family ATPase [Gammaproteobacteria bacterium]
MSLKSPGQRYQQDLRRPDFQADPVQAEAIIRLDQLFEQLVSAAQPGRFWCHWWQWLSGFWRAPRNSVPRGVYLWGPVGSGKTYLLDTLFAAVPGERKRRVHFHRFMRGIHADLRRLGQVAEPLQLIAREMAAEIDLLCFDELQVNDIADAMLIAGLFGHLMDQGVVFVATSNRPPRDLYKHGLQRARFLPAIDLIEARMDILRVDGGTDYRFRSLQGIDRYYCPAGEASEAELRAVFSRLEGADPDATTIDIGGREFWVKGAGSDVVWFDFFELCEKHRAAMDYIELGERYHTLLLSNVPAMKPDDQDAAHRFMMLIDEIYDRRLNLFLSAQTLPAQLYPEGRYSFEFQRSVSRLMEMQSAEYAAQAGHHRDSESKPASA